jgi:hypothetical protein
MQWPIGVDDRLRLLVDLASQQADAAGTSASELVAALICDQPLDGLRLADLVGRYRAGGSDAAVPAGPTQDLAGGSPRRGRPRASATEAT